MVPHYTKPKELGLQLAYEYFTQLDEELWLRENSKSGRELGDCLTRASFYGWWNQGLENSISFFKAFQWFSKPKQTGTSKNKQAFSKTYFTSVTTVTHVAF